MAARRSWREAAAAANVQPLTRDKTAKFLPATPMTPVWTVDFVKLPQMGTNASAQLATAGLIAKSGLAPQIPVLITESVLNPAQITSASVQKVSQA